MATWSLYKLKLMPTPAPGSGGTAIIVSVVVDRFKNNAEVERLSINILIDGTIGQLITFFPDGTPINP